jgi:hypothetical protein
MVESWCGIEANVRQGPTFPATVVRQLVMTPASLALPRASKVHFLYPSSIWLRCCELLLQPSTMVVLVDLDNGPPFPHAPRAPGFIRDMKPVHHSLAPAVIEEHGSAPGPDERPNPNMNGFSAALSCYP